jgi:hypothetical protein
MPRHFRAPLFDASGDQHMAVAHAADYEVVTVLWRRRVGNGSITCKLLRAKKPAKRIVQLHAEWTDAGVPTACVCQVHSPEEEQADAARLERQILAASRRPEEPSKLRVVGGFRGSPAEGK